MKRINNYLSEVEIKSLKEISKKTGISFSEHVRRAIDKYIKDYNDDNLQGRK